MKRVVDEVMFETYAREEEEEEVPDDEDDDDDGRGFGGTVNASFLFSDSPLLFFLK